MIRGSTIIALLAVVAAVSCKPSHHKKYYKKELEIQPKKGPGCGGKPADVFFLLDTSSSIWSVDFKKQCKFVSKVVDMFEIGPNDTRVGVATFSTRYHPQFGFTKYQEKEELKAAINEIRYSGGNTDTAEALLHMKLQEFSKARPGISKIAIVMTDGKSRDFEETLKEAGLAKSEGIHIFAFGIGNNINETELVGIGSHPPEKFVFKVANFDALESLKVKLELGPCEVEPVPLMQKDEPPVCSRDTMADVMFVFDSAAMGEVNTYTIQEYIGNVAGEFNFEDNMMRAGVISTVCDNIQLREHLTEEEFVRSVRNREYPELSHVIHKMRHHSFTVEQGAREQANRMAVIFVDSPLDVEKRVFNEIKKAKSDDIEIFVVAIGENVDMAQVEFMAASPDHVILVPNYEVMTDTSAVLVDTLCAGL